MRCEVHYHAGVLTVSFVAVQQAERLGMALPPTWQPHHGGPPQL